MPSNVSAELETNAGARIRKAEQEMPSQIPNGQPGHIENPAGAHHDLEENGKIHSAHNHGQHMFKNFAELGKLDVPSPVRERAEDEEARLENRGVAGARMRSRKMVLLRIWTEAVTISYLIFFSIMGTLARLGLEALTIYPGAPVQTGVLWANVGGSFVMGFLIEDRKLFAARWEECHDGSDQPREPNEHPRPHVHRAATNATPGAIKKTIPIYIGLTTGFCGSFTSFSSFIRDTFYALANALPVPVDHPSGMGNPVESTINLHRNPGYSFMATLAVLITTLGLSLALFQAGAHLAQGLKPKLPTISVKLTRNILDPGIIILAILTWTGAAIMTALAPMTLNKESWRGKALFALVFAPPGTLLRFYLSHHLNNPLRKSFAWGTFTSNILGTFLAAGFLALQHAHAHADAAADAVASTHHTSILEHQVLQGLQDGFCGCLTTISTFIAEIHSQRIRQRGYIYAGVSVGVGLAGFVTIAGSVLWTRGF